jgi:hypothetical protein
MDFASVLKETVTQQTGETGSQERIKRISVVNSNNFKPSREIIIPIESNSRALSRQLLDMAFATKSCSWSCNGLTAR